MLSLHELAFADFLGVDTDQSPVVSSNQTVALLAQVAEEDRI